MTTERLLRKASQAISTTAATGIVSAMLLVSPTGASAQYAVSDTQLQSNVTSALHADAKLSGAAIAATASQGVVTLTGNVADEQARTEAEQVAAGVSGIRSIQDNINVTGGASAAASAPAAQNMPPAQNDANAGEPATTSGQPSQNGSELPPPPPAEPGTAASGMPPAPPSDDQAQNAPYTPYPNGAAQQQGQYPQQQGQYPQQSAQNGYPQQQYPQPYPQQGQYPQYPNAGYPQDGDNGGYGPRGNARPPRPGIVFAVSPQQQNASGPVSILPGTLLSVRTTQPLSTQTLKGGEFFEATAATDTYVNGVVAIPRGAVLTGQVVVAKNAGPFGGSPKLELKLTTLQLGATTYPVASEVWSSQGPSKTGYTAANTAGGAVVGALIGGVTGGGLGAGIGAIAGGTGGALISGATHGPRLDLPPEAVLQFHLEQPLTVQPLHYDDAERLAASVPQQPVLRQRPAYIAAPYPGPYYVRPYPYPY